MVREVKGCITLLGNSKQGINSKSRDYSVIEIGGQVLQNITISTKLDNFLSRGLRWDGECVLYLVNDNIFALTTPDGKTYCAAHEVGYVLDILLGVIGAFAVLGAFGLFQENSSASGLLLLCVGGLFLWGSYYAFKHDRAYNGFLKAFKLKSGAIEIK